MRYGHDDRYSHWSYVRRRGWNDFYYDGRYLYSMPIWLGRLIVIAFFAAWLFAVVAIVGAAGSIFDLWASFFTEMSSAPTYWTYP